MQKIFEIWSHKHYNKKQYLKIILHKLYFTKKRADLLIRPCYDAMMLMADFHSPLLGLPFFVQGKILVPLRVKELQMQPQPKKLYSPIP